MMCSNEKVQRDLQELINELAAIQAVYEAISTSSKAIKGLLEWLGQITAKLEVAVQALNLD
ncbi:MAG: hypothetical protein CMI04_08760 [Oceanospirillaceae bacterium]|nr:hypothetical protein [Oceanospirillaceae bacterium]|tara:strand:- start:22034 stop:22216 length:183 start_codon:yes stop_codon:yes gene_type:complete